MLKLQALFMVFLIFTFRAEAKDVNNYGLVGVGSVSCKVHLAQSVTNSAFSDVSTVWAQGFLSGINAGGYRAAGHDLIVIPDGELIKKFVSAYCVRDSDKTVLQALVALFDVLKHKHELDKRYE